ncbi:MAG TPA: lipoyl domain-containing protein [Streptosporangiaceae bacterium]|jgi:pyruvate/2-oxoglutarate dehydrogenase complex dihydrolipoamide acyltransferase (E2) component|nr:lipoyl domain-containing protein [Streptosporangiaceae bacterium]
MASRLKIPKLGMSMNEATIVQWLVADGDAVQVGQPLYLLETDKTENEVPSPVAGVIKLIGVVDETYEVGTVIAEIS